MFAIRQLADVAAHRVFAGFGEFMLERTVKSLVDFDDPAIEGEQHEVACPEIIAHGADRRCGNIAKLVDLESRLSPTYLH